MNYQTFLDIQDLKRCPDSWALYLANLRNDNQITEEAHALALRYNPQDAAVEDGVITLWWSFGCGKSIATVFPSGNENFVVY